MVAYLEAEGDLTTVATGGIHPGVAPQGQARPYITWTRIGDEPSHLKTEAAPLSMATFQFDTWADTALGCEALSEALRGELDGYQGDWGDTDVRHVRVDNESDGIEQPDDGREAAIYRCTFTVTIWYARSVPVF
jgi:hypothetical protein